MPMMSPGVWVARRMGIQSATETAVTTSEIMAKSHTALPTYLRRVVISLAPKHWAIGTAKPIPMALQKPKIRKFTEPMEPTAARACSPRVLLTMAVSATL